MTTVLRLMMSTLHQHPSGLQILALCWLQRGRHHHVVVVFGLNSSLAEVEVAAKSEVLVRTLL